MEMADVIEMLVDILFGIDIIVNFVSAYEDPKDGLPIISFKKISVNYLTGWFFLDLIAVFPVQVFEGMFSGESSGEGAVGNKIKMVRLARLPRLYRLVRVLRMIKMLRVFRRNSAFKEWLDNLNVSVGIIRMVKVLVLMGFLVHLMSCFWFLAATLEESLFDTWVGNRDPGLIDAEMSDQYF